MAISPIHRRTRSPNLPDLLGRTDPAWCTAPLRDLQDPGASYGPAVIQFADRVCRTPLDPWEAGLVLRVGELTGDNLPRFRQVLTIVARQNGKSFLLRILAGFWLFVSKYTNIVGVANKLDLARESWDATVKLARSVPALERRIATVRTTNGQERLITVEGCRYLVAAAGKDTARGYSVDRAVWDEMRQESDWETHSALLPTMAAIADAQLFMITNMGTDSSVVLNDTLDNAVKGTDPTLGAFVWQAPADADPQDPEAWAAANPNLGRRVLVADISAHAARAVASGGEPLMRFKQERLCIRTRLMDPAIDPQAWARCLDRGSLDYQRDRLAAAVDLSLDGLHATLAVAAVLPDGRVRVEVVRGWDGRKCTDQVRTDLPALLSSIRPRSFGWLPGGPGASLTPTFRQRQGWPAGLTGEEIRAELPTVCMAFADLVAAGRVAHSGQALLDAHIGAAEKLRSGDRWTFSRRGAGGCDAAYAVAAAVYLGQSMPRPVGKPRLVVAV